MHTRWPTGFQGTPEDALAENDGKQMILGNFPNYLWFAVFEVLELHVPFVNGWGLYYNIAALLSMILVYFGMLWAIPLFFKREPYILILVALIVYHTGIFALTDATPRYLLPVLLCYTALSGIGYSRLLPRIFRWNA